MPTTTQTATCIYQLFKMTGGSSSENQVTEEERKPEINPDVPKNPLNHASSDVSAHTSLAQETVPEVNAEGENGEVSVTEAWRVNLKSVSLDKFK